MKPLSNRVRDCGTYGRVAAGLPRSRPPPSWMRSESMDTILACKTCDLVQRVERLRPGTAAECCRCGSIVAEYRTGNLARTGAFSLAALILYVPANVYPILRMQLYGAYSDSTVWDGCVSLIRNDQWLVGAIVFVASILIPLFKLIGLFTLVVTTNARSARARTERMWIYRIIAVIGPWAMLDVFLLAVLVALVKLGELATILPGPGLLAFTAVVALTTLASASFDPALIWRRLEAAP